MVVLDALQTQKSNERHQFYSKKIILFTCISEFVDQKGRKDVVNVVLLSYEHIILHSEVWLPFDFLGIYRLLLFLLKSSKNILNSSKIS